MKGLLTDQTNQIAIVSNSNATSTLRPFLSFLSFVFNSALLFACRSFILV